MSGTADLPQNAEDSLLVGPETYGRERAKETTGWSRAGETEPTKTGALNYLDAVSGSGNPDSNHLHIPQVVEHVERLLQRGRMEEALSYLYEVQLHHPQDPALGRGIEAMEKHLRPQYMLMIPDMTDVPVSSKAPSDSELDDDQREVASLVSGRANYLEIVETSNMSRFRAIRALVRLLRRGSIVSSSLTNGSKPSTQSTAMLDGASHENTTAEAVEGKITSMSNVKSCLQEAMRIDGAIAAALVDYESGMTLGTAGGESFDIEVAASANTQVVRAKMAVMHQLGISGGIEDILITLEEQYHLIRPVANQSSLFLYVALRRSSGNLGMARHQLKAIESAISL